MSIINVFQYYHLGHSIINFIFFYKIKKYIEENNIIINYYCHKKYHNNLLDFKCSDNINICDIDSFVFLEIKRRLKLRPIRDVSINNVKHSVYHLWQATENIPKGQPSAEDMLCCMFNLFLQHYNIPIRVNEFEYQDNDLIKRYSLLEENYKNIDILIINSTPMSDQYSYDKPSWDDFIIKLSNKYKVAVSEKINKTNENIVCLNDVSVKNIAAIALGVKKIIAINTGPSIPLYNTDILNTVEAIYLFGAKGCVPTIVPFKTRKIKEVSDLKELDFLF
jgi:hypothetical protein